MPPYKKMYLTLFNSITDALEALRKSEWTNAVCVLTDAQKEAERLYCDGEEKLAPPQ